MPPNVRGNSGREVDTKSFRSLNFQYDYPRNLSLKPGEDQHDRIVSKLLDRARDSYLEMQDRHQEWREVDKKLKAYARPRTEQEKKDGAVPEVVLPFSFANLETLLTFMVSAFLKDPIFQYKGIGPEDSLGASLLEQHIAYQSNKKRFGLNLHTMWRDGFCYGFGAVTPKWTEEHGTRTRVRETGFFDRLDNIFFPTERNREPEETLLYEGHELENIDPYRYLPDPNVAVHDVQKAEYVGWISRMNIMELLRNEENSDRFFNAKYVKEGMSDATTDIISGISEREKNRESEKVGTNNPVDVTWMYVDLIPNDWGLSSSASPEKWLFGLAGDQVLVAAQPLGLHHNRFPVAVAAPDYDGYSADPPGRINMINDMQEVIDFLYTSHLTNIKKAINDMFVVDPKLVNIYDVTDPKPGKVIRMRRAAWGSGKIDEGVKQLEVADVTKGHIEEASYLLDVMEQVSGATDVAKGVVQNSGPRISAAASRSARRSVLSRMQKTARIVGMQAHQPLGELLAFQTQQLLSNETYVEITGNTAEKLKDDLGLDPQRLENGRVAVDPFELIINFDIKSVDPSVPGSEDVEKWTEVYQAIGNNPALAQEFDMVRLFKHIARQMGAKNVDDFIKRAEPPSVMNQQQAEEQARQGNLTEIQQNGQSNGTRQQPTPGTA